MDISRFVFDQVRVGGLVCDLGDGTEVHVVRQLFNVRVSSGQSGSTLFDRQY